MRTTTVTTTARATMPATIRGTPAEGLTTAAGITSPGAPPRRTISRAVSHRGTAFFFALLLICEFRADEKNGAHERGDPRRLSRHCSHAGCLPQARGARGA